MGVKLAGRRESGLDQALQLGDAARDLAEEGAAAGENAAAEQADLFLADDVFGRVRIPDGRETLHVGPGRPRGSRSRSTKEIIKLIEAQGTNPILALAKIVATPIDVIAATLGCDKLEAAEYWRKCAAELAPYVAQKLPTAVQLTGANAGMLVIHLGAPPGEGGQGLPITISATPPAPLIEHEENQGLSGEADGTSHDEQVTREGK